ATAVTGTNATQSASPRGQRRGSRPASGIPARFKMLNGEFAAMQQRLGLSAETARDMRAQVFASVDPTSGEQHASRYPAGVDAQTVALRVAFARLIRPYITKCPPRGAAYCATICARIAPVLGQGNGRLAALHLQATFVRDYSVDELLAYCLHQWQF